MNNEKDFWSEVRCTYNNEEGFWCVDAYKTDDPDEQGEVIAAIHETSGDVYYVNQLARHSALAHEVIKAKVAECKPKQMYVYSHTHLDRYNNKLHTEVEVYTNEQDAKAKVDETAKFYEGLGDGEIDDMGELCVNYGYAVYLKNDNIAKFKVSACDID